MVSWSFDLLWKNYGSMEKKLWFFSKLKSLSPFYFVKIRLPGVLCNEFLINMYTPLQIYTVEICTLSKIMDTCCKYNIYTRTF